jgi:hypothetical protein
MLQSISGPSEGKAIKRLHGELCRIIGHLGSGIIQATLGRGCSTVLELARVLVRCDHVARVIVNANHGMV